MDDAMQAMLEAVRAVCAVTTALGILGFVVKLVTGRSK